MAVIVIAVLGVTALVVYSNLPLPVSVKQNTFSEKILLLDFGGRFASVRQEDYGVLLEWEGAPEDSITLPFAFNPMQEDYTITDMYVTIAGHTLVQESECTFTITLNDQVSQTVNDYIDETAVSWFSVHSESGFYDILKAGINTLTLHGYQADNDNFFLYQVFLYVEYQYTA